MKTQVRLATGLIGLVMGLAMLAFWIDRPTAPGENPKWSLTGQTLVYSLEYKNQGEMLLTPLGTLNPGTDAPRVPFQIAIGPGELRIQARASEQESLVLQLNADKVQLQLGSLSPEEEADVRQALQKPFALRLSKKGVPEEYYFEKTAPLLARNILRQLAGGFFPALELGDLERSNFSGIETWQVSRDAEGSDIKILENAQSMVLKEAALFQASLEGTSMAEWEHSSGWMQSIDHKKSTKILQGHTMVAQEQSILKAAFRSEENTRLAFDNSASRSYPAHTMEGYQHANEALLRQKVKGKDFNLELNALMQSPIGNIAEQQERYSILLAFLKLDPSLLAILRDIMRDLDPKEMPFDILATLLAKSGWPEGQHMLVQLAKDLSKHPDVSGQLLFNIGLLENPDRAVVIELKQWMDSLGSHDPLFNPVASQAASAAFKLKDSAIKADIAASLSQAYEDPATRRPSLIALGNLGAEEILAKVDALFLSQHARDRQDAVTMLRRIEGPSRRVANEYLLRASSTDQDVSVRREASSYLQFRHLNASEIASLAQSLGRESDSMVAGEIIRGIGAQSTHDKNLSRQVLLDFLETCGTPKLCEAARNQLLTM